jgi:ABC-2 type transport system ATP-binding protein
MPQEVVAQLRNVTKQYGPTTALDDVTLNLHRGELLALLGPNGAGKTSAVRLLLGLSSPTSGSVAVFGGDPREDANRSRTGVMLQASRVADTLRVREHIALFSSYYRDPLPLPEVLRIARLEALQKRLFKDLSGGEQQRVLFALAICGNPDLLVLDEPTVGLDVRARRAFWGEIKRLRETGRTVLLTTHYLAEADALADRLVVIDRGRILAEGTPVEIKGNAATLEDAFVALTDDEEERVA